MGAIFWAILTSVFALLEIIIPGLVTIWLALAALVVTALAGFINNSYIEAFIFSVLSLIFILFTRPVLQNYLKKRRKNDFSSAMSGSEIKIEKVINYWGAAFESVLEKTEYYFENSENIKIEEVNKRVYLDYDFDSKFIKILLKE